MPAPSWCSVLVCRVHVHECGSLHTCVSMHACTCVSLAPCFPPTGLQGDCTRVSTIDDHKDFVIVKKALSVLGFSDTEVRVRDCMQEMHIHVHVHIHVMYMYIYMYVIQALMFFFNIFLRVCGTS